MYSSRLASLPTSTKDKSTQFTYTNNQFYPVCIITTRLHFSILFGDKTRERPVLDIYNKMKESKKIILATDGGAIKYKGFLGFVMMASNGTVLLFYFRQPAGLNPLSSHSEACVFLAATRLIFLILQHYDKLITNAIDIF